MPVGGWQLMLLLHRRAVCSGAFLHITLCYECLPFFFSLFLKCGGFRLFSKFFKKIYIDGICIGVRSRFFGSTVSLRFVAENFLVQRTFPLFSPFLVDVRRVKLSLITRSKFKSKLFTLKASSQKRLLSLLL